MHAISFDEVRPVTVIRRELPSDLQRILSRCLRKRPEDRYPGADALPEDPRRFKDTLESGSQHPVGFRERISSVVEWFRFSMPVGPGGLFVLLAVLALVALLITAEASLGSFILILLMGLPVYRFVRNRRSRMLRRFVNKVSRMPEVTAIAVRGNLITGAVEQARANLYIQLNSLVQAANRKLFMGIPGRLWSAWGARNCGLCCGSPVSATSGKEPLKPTLKPLAFTSSRTDGRGWDQVHPCSATNIPVGRGSA
jgi:hypothetical protein